MKIICVMWNININIIMKVIYNDINDINNNSNNDNDNENINVNENNNEININNV